MPKQMTPMMRHYIELKEKHSDCLLFYRLGDFYEMFFEDAVKASKELDLVLTGRDCGLSERAPMRRRIIPSTTDQRLTTRATGRHLVQLRTRRRRAFP